MVDTRSQNRQKLNKVDKQTEITKEKTLIDKTSQTESDLHLFTNMHVRNKHMEAQTKHNNVFRNEYKQQLVNEAKMQIPNLFNFSSEQKNVSNAETKNPTVITNLRYEVQQLTRQNVENKTLLNELKDCLKKQQNANKKLKDELSNKSKKHSESTNANSHENRKVSNENTNNGKLNMSSQEENEIVPSLQQEISHLRRKLTVATSERSRIDGLSSVKMNDIKNENERLRKELSSFSLDFFEEIEDLKFKYNEATKRLASYGEDITTAIGM
jgi:hypothetical protein